MSTEYVTVAESNAPDAESEEFQLEADGSLLMSTLRVRYPTATGLRYRNPETNSFRALKVQDDRILPPSDELGWRERVFFIVLPKGVSLDGSFGDGENRKRSLEDANYGDDTKRGRVDEYEGNGKGELVPPTVDLLVRGMPVAITEEEVRAEISKYGELITVDLKKNKKVERPKDAFAFIRFKDRDVQRNFLLQKSIFLFGSNLSVRRADMKKYADIDPLRLFITKLADGPDLDEKLRNHFSHYGKITDLYIPRKQFRGYGFITFEMPDSVLEAIDDGERHLLEDGSRIVVTLASPRQPPGSNRSGTNPPESGSMMPMGRGMRPDKGYGTMGRGSPMSYSMPRDYGSRGMAPGPDAEDVAQAFYSLLNQMTAQNPEPASGRGFPPGRGRGRR